MNKNYFKYLVQQNKKLLLISTLFGFALVPVITLVNVSSYVEKGYSSNYCISAFVLYLALLIGQAYIIPLVNYRFIQYKRSNDTFLSLPIKRLTLFKTITLFSFFEMYIPYLVNVILGAVVLVIKGYPFNFINFLYFIVISLLLVTVLYFLNTFIILKCNTTLDSVVCMIGYSLLPLFIFFAQISFMETYLFGINDYFDMSYHQSVVSMIMASISFLSTCFGYYGEMSYEFVWLFIYLAIGIAFAASSAIVFVRRKAEDSEQITNSKWMYRLLIPLYAVVSISYLNLEHGVADYIISIIFIFIAYCVGNFIANRQFKVTRFSLLLFVSVIVFTNFLGYVFEKTVAPKISATLPTDYAYVRVNLSSESQEYGIGSNIDILIDEDIILQIQNLQKQLVKDHYDDVRYKDYHSFLHVTYYDNNDSQINSYYYSFTSEMAKSLYVSLNEHGEKLYCYEYNKPNSQECNIAINKLDMYLK